MTKPPTLAQRYEAAIETGRPLVGGHRGNPDEFPENTLASFRSAVELGVDLIECDVHMSSDGRLVVIHDHSLERTTNGSGLVMQHEWDDLRRLDAGRGERLPLLDEVIEIARSAGCGLAIEIKQLPFQYPGMERRVVDELRAADFIEHTCVISFFHPALPLLKSIEPRLQVGLLEGARPINATALMEEARADIYSPHFGALDGAQVDELHAAGRVVGVWTVDDEAGLAWCRVCRPDSIFSNRPRWLLNELARAVA